MTWDSVCDVVFWTRTHPHEELTGKTVQMIALMSKNMPGPREEDRTTLIVVPAALMQQVNFDESVLLTEPLTYSLTVEGRTRDQDQRTVYCPYPPW